MANRHRHRARRLIESGSLANLDWKDYGRIKAIHLLAYGDEAAADKFANDFVCEKVLNK